MSHKPNAVPVLQEGTVYTIILDNGRKVHDVTHWPIFIQPWSVFLSFAVCTVTGVFFGWYPAKKLRTCLFSAFPT